MSDKEKNSVETEVTGYLVRRHPQFQNSGCVWVPADNDGEARARLKTWLVEHGMNPELPYLIKRIGDAAPPGFWEQAPLLAAITFDAE